MNQEHDLLKAIEEGLAEILTEAKSNHTSNIAGYSSLDIPALRDAVKQAPPDLAAKVKAAASFTKNRGYAKGFLDASLRIFSLVHRWRIDHPTPPQEPES